VGSATASARPLSSTAAHCVGARPAQGVHVGYHRAVCKRATEAGRMLSGLTLRKVLESSNKVFIDGSWDPANLTTSGYFTRLAGSPLAIPDGKDGFQLVRESDPPCPVFALRPGESALVSTTEKFSVDLDISIVISTRFGIAARGLLLLHGGTAHPGYGRTKDAAGSWKPADDVRLYFVVANVGPADVTLEQGDRLAYLQFFRVEPDTSQSPVYSQGYEYLQHKLFRPDSDQSGLAFFRGVRDLREHVGKIQIEVDALSRDVKHANYTAGRATDASNFVVVFGVFLVAAALFGAVLSPVGDVLERAKGLDDWTDYLLVVIGGLYALAAVGGTIAVVVAIRKAMSLGDD